VKTTIQTFDSKKQLSTIFGEKISPWHSAALGGGVPKDGNVTTLYDENNQATELQIRGADGAIICRFVRTYNTNGRVTEEKIIWENPAAYILDDLPQVYRDRMTPERLNRYIEVESIMLRGKSQIGAFYTFDEQNRLVKKVERSVQLEKTTTITYNDQGDKVEMRATFADNAAIPSACCLTIDETGIPIRTDETGTPVPIHPDATPDPSAPNWLPEGYSVRYVYQYDSFGNWVQLIRIVSKASQSDESGVWNRTLSYYHPQ
jgi:hypothetical protein